MIFIVFFVFFLFSQVFGFGCIQTKNQLKAGINQTAIFEIIFWSDKEEEILFSYEINKPAEVMIIPNPLTLSPNKKEGEIVIGGKIYNVTKVKILVIPRESGKYEINLTTSTQVQPKGINVVDERKFSFVLDVEGKNFEDVEEEKINQPFQFLHSPNFIREILTAFALILIILVSFIIYKIS